MKHKIEAISILKLAVLNLKIENCHVQIIKKSPQTRLQMLQAIIWTIPDRKDRIDFGIGSGLYGKNVLYLIFILILLKVHIFTIFVVQMFEKLSHCLN